MTDTNPSSEQKLDELKLPDNRQQAERTTPCDHSQWTFKKHGRVCPCGVFMIDFGD